MNLKPISFMKAALLSGLFFFGTRANAELPTFTVTTSYPSSRLTKGTQDEIDRYNKWVSDNSQNPTSAQEAVLDFGSRKVRVYLIGSYHAGPRDVSFVEDALSRLGVDPAHANLFIEQGDEASPGGGASNLIAKIHSAVPELNAALDEAMQSPHSILNPTFTHGLVFATVARDWLARGGRFVNFDAASNFSDEAFSFFRANLDNETAVRIIREELFGVTFSWEDFTLLLTKGYRFSSLQRIDDCCSTLKAWVPWQLDDNQLRNLVRERYMRFVLAQGLKDGDVIVTHPVHLRNVLAPERLDGNPP